MRTPPSAVLAFVTGVTLLAFAAQSRAQEDWVDAHPLTPRYLEAPGDPPASVAARDDIAARSPGMRVAIGPYVSVQVNVDELGDNIVGDAANEPSISVNPLDADNLVVGWRQFDSVTSNFRQGGWGYSFDGGATWTFAGVLEPGVFRSDPVIDVTSQGQFFYYSLQSDFSAQFFRSTDGGMSWGAPVPGWGGDKNWMVIDRSGGPGDGHVYGAWQAFFNCCGDRTFTRSIDGGDSYQSPVEITNNPSFGILAVGPDGETYATGVRSTFSQDFSTFVIARSDDARDAAATPTFQGRVVDLGGSMVGFSGPNPDGLAGQAYVAVDSSQTASRGNVYMLASVDPAGSDPLDVHLVRSSDGGLTWSQPVRVNDDPPGNGAWQWFGTLSVAPSGRLDVVWNDTRASGQVNVAELYYAYSHDGGETWSENVAVSPPFDSFVGWPNQNKLGDYYSMVSDRAGAALAWASTLNGEQDVYYTRLFPDCNGNGVSDVVDIDGGGSGDANGNDIPDECEGGLLLLPPDPGEPGGDSVVGVTGGTPGETILFLRGRLAGSTPVPGCDDTTVEIANPRRLGSAVVEADGTASVTVFIPPAQSGQTLLFQAVQRPSCVASNRVDWLVP